MRCDVTGRSRWHEINMGRFGIWTGAGRDGNFGIRTDTPLPKQQGSGSRCKMRYNSNVLNHTNSGNVGVLEIMLGAMSRS